MTIRSGPKHATKWKKCAGWKRLLKISNLFCVFREKFYEKKQITGTLENIGVSVGEIFDKFSQNLPEAIKTTIPDDVGSRELIFSEILTRL